MTLYSASNPVPLNALPASSGYIQKFLVGATNTGASTFSPDGLTAAPIFGLGGSFLQGGELISAGVATLVSYVGSALNGGNLCWVLFDCTGGAVQVGIASKSLHAAQAGQVASGSLLTAAAGGSANAISASFPISGPSYVDGQPFTILASATNTGTVTATLSLGGIAQASLPVVKGSNQPLIAGDIPATGYPIALHYSATFGALVMENPATGIAARPPAAFQAITVTVASNVLNCAYIAQGAVSFRNPVLNSGIPVSASITTNLGLAVPSGATLGSFPSVQARIVWLLLYNGGAPVLGVTNLAGGLNLDETTLISSVAISSGANANNVVYTSSAVSNSPFRVVGFCDITEATAGSWATGPSTVQGEGGQALASLSSLGFGQTWQPVSRSAGVTYFNTTGRPIVASGWATSSDGGNLGGFVNGVQVALNGSVLGSGQGFGVTFVVPAGANYFFSAGGSATFVGAAELR